MSSTLLNLRIFFPYNLQLFQDTIYNYELVLPNLIFLVNQFVFFELFKFTKRKFKF